MNGEKRRRHGRSIRRRLLVPICLLLTVQVAVLIGGVYFSGLLERMDENAYAVLDQRVQSRAGYLEDDMVRRWSNLSLTQEVLGELYEGLVQDGSVTPGELASDPAQYNAFLEQAAPELVSLMRTNSVTGAFVVLNTQTFPQELSESLQLPGLYLRDRDPSAHTSAGNGDLIETMTLAQDGTISVQCTFRGKDTGTIRGVWHADGQTLFTDIQEGTAPYQAEFIWSVDGRELTLTDESGTARYVRND